MQLPRRLFQQITGAQLIRSSDYPKERHKASRLPVSGRISVLALKGGSVGRPAFARLRDLSLAGLGLLSHQRLSAGEQFIVAVAASSGRPILMRCQAARCHEVEPGLFVVGAQFSEVLSLQNAPPAEAAAAAHRAAI